MKKKIKKELRKEFERVVVLPAVKRTVEGLLRKRDLFEMYEFPPFTVVAFPRTDVLPGIDVAVRCRPLRSRSNKQLIKEEFQIGREWVRISAPKVDFPTRESLKQIVDTETVQ